MVLDLEGKSAQRPFEPVQSGDFGNWSFSIVSLGKLVRVTGPDGIPQEMSWQRAVEMQRGIRHAAAEQSRR